MGEVIKDVIGFALSGSNVRSDFFIPEDLWPVEFDKDQMKHVFANLAANANEAMPEGGTLKVHIENVAVSGRETPPLPLQAGRYVKISIQDQGVGIPEEHLPMIFDPYFSTKEMGDQKGMGLGRRKEYV